MRRLTKVELLYSACDSAGLSYRSLQCKAFKIVGELRWSHKSNYRHHVFKYTNEYIMYSSIQYSTFVTFLSFTMIDDCASEPITKTRCVFASTCTRTSVLPVHINILIRVSVWGGRGYVRFGHHKYVRYFICPYSRTSAPEKNIGDALVDEHAEAPKSRISHFVDSL